MSLFEVRAENQMWILTRFRLAMERYPMFGDTVTVETWTSSRTDGLRAIRDFRFLNDEGSVLGRAFSIWLLLDMTRKRPVHLPPVILEIRNTELSDPVEFEFPRLIPPGNPDRKKTIEVGWKELDVNNHANNVNYVEWGLEALPFEVNRGHTLRQLDIEFLGEALYGDKIDSAAELRASTYSHLLSNQDGKALAVMETFWDF